MKSIKKYPIVTIIRKIILEQEDQLKKQFNSKNQINKDKNSIMNIYQFWPFIWRNKINLHLR